MSYLAGTTVLLVVMEAVQAAVQAGCQVQQEQFAAHVMGIGNVILVTEQALANMLNREAEIKHVEHVEGVANVIIATVQAIYNQYPLECSRLYCYGLAAICGYIDKISLTAMRLLYIKGMAVKIYVHFLHSGSHSQPSGKPMARVSMLGYLAIKVFNCRLKGMPIFTLSSKYAMQESWA